MVPPGRRAARTLLVGLGIGLLYVLIDAVEDFYLVNEPSLISALFAPNAAEVWARLFFIAIALILAFLYNQERSSTAALAESERRYRTLAESAHDSIYIIDNIGRISYVNSFGAQQFRRLPDEIVGKHLDQLFPPETAAHLSSVVKNVFESRLPFAHEERLDFPNRAVWMDTRLVPIIKNGNVEAVLGVSRDITKRRDAATALKYSEKRFRAIADTANDAIITIDSAGKIVFWNRAAERLFNRAAAEALGADITLVVPERYRRAHQSSFARFLRTGKPGRIIGRTLEIEGLRQDKSEFPLELSVAVWKTGQETFFTGIIRDISERRQTSAEREEAAKLSSALNAIQAAIASTLRIETVLGPIMSEAALALECESAALVLRERDRWVAKYLYNLPVGRLEAALPASAATPLLPVGQDRPIMINRLESDGRIDSKVARVFGPGPLLATSLMVAENVIGGLFLSGRSAAAPFNKRQTDFAKTLTAAVSLALENSRLYEMQRNIADTLQEALLETPKQLEGVEFDCYYRAATELARVGGDFYDIFEVGPGRVGIVVGDVSGKGLPAAGLTSLVKSTIKAYAYEQDSPAGVIGRTNDAVIKAVAKNTFVTVFFGVLDTRTGVMRYCSAGHPPPIIKTASAARFLNVSSAAIGVFPHLSYTEGTEILSKGDILVIYTDGITEARRDRDFFGEKRLLDLVEQIEPHDAREVPRLIFDHVLRYSRAGLADDAALMAVSLAREAKHQAAA